MKRVELELCIGKYVEITLFDGDVIKGILYKTRTERYKSNPNLYYKQNYYVLENECDINDFSCLFRCSHVKKVAK